VYYLLIPMPAITRIISGGQTGVDQAALRAARECGLEIGGWCPPGRVCESGLIPEEFPLEETERERSPDAPDVARSQRTEWNVRDSDGTLVIQVAEESDPGTDWAIKCAARYGKPALVCDVSDPAAKRRIQEWLAAFRIETLSVGGPSEGTCPGIGERIYALLTQVFQIREAARE
jgi:hypothetical protein